MCWVQSLWDSMHALRAAVSRVSQWPSWSWSWAVSCRRVECLGWRATIRRDRQKVHGQSRFWVEMQCSARWSCAGRGAGLLGRGPASAGEVVMRCDGDGERGRRRGREACRARKKCSARPQSRGASTFKGTARYGAMCCRTRWCRIRGPPARRWSENERRRVGCNGGQRRRLYSQCGLRRCIQGQNRIQGQGRCRRRGRCVVEFWCRGRRWAHGLAR